MLGVGKDATFSFSPAGFAVIYLLVTQPPTVRFHAVDFLSIKVGHRVRHGLT